MLKRHKFWHYTEKFRALWMLGKNPHDVYEDRVVQRIFLACNVAHPEVSDGDNEMLNLWDECYQAKMGIPGKPMYVLQLDNIRGLRPPTPSPRRPSSGRSSPRRWPGLAS